MGEMLQLRVGLMDCSPEVWRRLLVDPRLTLEQLHTAIQVSFGWMNCHLHQFHEHDGRRYALPHREDSERAIDERKVLLGAVFDRTGKRIRYESDFGDAWIHSVELEEVVDGEAVEYPFDTFVKAGRSVFSGKVRAAICIVGARSGSPGDCGGPPGFEDIVRLKTNPPARLSAGDRERLEWLGDWEPDFCLLADINQNLGRIRVKKAFKGAE